VVRVMRRITRPSLTGERTRRAKRVARGGSQSRISPNGVRVPGRQKKADPEGPAGGKVRELLD